MTGAVPVMALLAAIAACLALAVTDARRRVLPWPWLALLFASGAAWRLSGGASGQDAMPALVDGVVGATVGMAPVVAAIAWAEWRNRRFPVMPGDGLMLGALGLLLGPVGLGWALLLGASAAAAHGACIQRKRGRSLRRFRAPLAPGMALGAVATLVAVHAGLLDAAQV